MILTGESLELNSSIGAELRQPFSNRQPEGLTRTSGAAEWCIIERMEPSRELNRRG